jgi:uncharacterized damage-inducible protein DinB
MSEIERITDQLRRAFYGEAWHGPAVKEALAGVTAQKAAARPVSGAHSIWEIAIHIAAWESFVLRRLRGEVIVDVADQEDWPEAHASEQAWQAALERLEQGHAELLKEVSCMREARLDEVVEGKGYTVYFMLHGVIQHDLYHAGQIALLKKAQG